MKIITTPYEGDIMTPGHRPIPIPGAPARRAPATSMPPAFTLCRPGLPLSADSGRRQNMETHRPGTVRGWGGRNQGGGGDGGGGDGGGGGGGGGGGDGGGGGGGCVAGGGGSSGAGVGGAGGVVGGDAAAACGVGGGAGHGGSRGADSGNGCDRRCIKGKLFFSSDQQTDVLVPNLTFAP